MLSTAVAAAGAVLVGGAVASATPPTPTLLSAYVNGIVPAPSLEMLLNVTWDGSVYTTESIVLESSESGTTGPFHAMGTYGASLGFVTHVGSSISIAYNDIAEVGAYASNGTDSDESWIGIDHYGT